MIDYQRRTPISDRLNWMTINVARLILEKTHQIVEFTNFFYLNLVSICIFLQETFQSASTGSMIINIHAVKTSGKLVKLFQLVVCSF